MKNLKFVIFCVICFLFVNSFLYADTIIENFRNKRNSLNRQGVTYSVSVSDEDNATTTEKCIVTEKGKNKFFEISNSYTKTIYLLCDDKLYQIPFPQEKSRLYSFKVILFPEEIKKNILKQYDYEIPDYSGCIAGDKATVNGYDCRIVTKIITETIKQNEQDFTTRQNITRMYIAERYGYPTRIEYLYKNSYSNSADRDEGFSKATVNFTNFNTDLTNKLTELPENALVIDYKQN